MSAGTSPIDALGVTASQGFDKINQGMNALEKTILNFQRVFDEQLAVIKKTFDATVVNIPPKPRRTDNT